MSYFNQGWIKNQLLRGGEYVFYGTFEVCGGLRRVTNPAFDAVDSPLAGAITPVYRLTAGLGQKVMQKLVREAVNRLVPLQPEILPRPLCEKYHLMERRQAFFEIHSPTDASTLEKARRRLMFEELLTLQLGLGLLKNRVREGTPVRIAPRSPEPFYAALPFEPTGAQRRAVAQAMDDFEKPWAMNRLLQGGRRQWENNGGGGIVLCGGRERLSDGAHGAHRDFGGAALPHAVVHALPDGDGGGPADRGTLR